MLLKFHIFLNQKSYPQGAGARVQQLGTVSVLTKFVFQTYIKKLTIVCNSCSVSDALFWPLLVPALKCT